jgi:hypothetical protein
VHDQPILDKVKTVRDCLPWVLDHFPDLLLGQLRELVNSLQLVDFIGNTERYAELVRSQQFVAEVVSLNNLEILHGFIANFEFQGGANCFERKEEGPKVVLNEPGVLREGFADIFWFLDNLAECVVILVVSDLEGEELDPEGVRIQGT